MKFENNETFNSLIKEFHKNDKKFVKKIKIPYKNAKYEIIIRKQKILVTLDSRYMQSGIIYNLVK